MGRSARKKQGNKPVASPRRMQALALMPEIGTSDFIPGPKLRAKLGISAVTLWRWRHDKTSSFPAPKVIKGRLYFPLRAITAWLAEQPEAA
jgi:predicted DNA-binding transcriptional regulator AlpA